MVHNISTCITTHIYYILIMIKKSNTDRGIIC